ncbi:MAG: hypothetical protein H0U17_11285 [Actinobacteria bacterium]|nr:hypothetical protein [Actinomycetota bacterium]
MTDVVDIEAKEPGFPSQRADRARDLALADGAQLLLALFVSDAVDTSKTEEEFFEMINSFMTEADLRGFLKQEVRRQLRRLDLQPFTGEAG